MNTPQSSDMQIYDIYEVIFIPWWQQWWFLGILLILCILIGYFCVRLYKRYKYKKSLYVDFFASAQKELALLRIVVAQNSEKYDAQELYDRLMNIFKIACKKYYHLDLSSKTIADYKRELENLGIQKQELIEFLDAAETALFSKNVSQELLVQHLECMQNFLNEIAQYKAIKQK